MSEFKILTLDEILAKTNKSTPTTNKPKSKSESKPHNPLADNSLLPNLSNNPPTPISSAPKRPKADNKPKKTPLLLDDELAQFLKDTPQLPIYDDDDKKIRYLRWLAFYYLSKKELSAHQLRQKLLAKDCDPDEVEKLLTEFAQKDYQSDERCAKMLVRESLRKGRGKQHIKNTLKQAKLPYDDDTIEQLLNENQEVMDNTILENANDDSFDNQDWLMLAVEARTKKYGNAIPKDPKEKARQLRFLQYRGFSMDICFDALKMGLDDLV